MTLHCPRSNLSGREPVNWDKCTKASRYFSTAVFTSSLLRTKTLSQLGYNEKEEKPLSSSQPVYPSQEKIPKLSYRFTTKPRFDVLDPVSLPVSTHVERRPLLSILTGA